MDSVRIKAVVDRVTTTLQRELASWNAVEEVANRIHDGAAGLRPINLHKDIKFEFRQRYDPMRAASVQDEISDAVNAERWVS